MPAASGSSGVARGRHDLHREPTGVGELLPEEGYELAERPDGHVLGLHYAGVGQFYGEHDPLVRR